MIVTVNKNKIEKKFPSSKDVAQALQTAGYKINIDYFDLPEFTGNIGDLIDHIDLRTGKRKATKELIKKSLLNRPLGHKLVGDTFVKMSEEEAVLSGDIPPPEGKIIKEGSLVNIPNYFIKKQYKENFEAFYESIKKRLEAIRIAKDKLGVNFNGSNISSDTESISILSNYITGDSYPIKWRTADNSFIQLKSATEANDLRIKLIKNNSDNYKWVWTIKDNIKEGLSNSALDKFISNLINEGII